MSVRTMVVWCRDWPVIAAGFDPNVPAAVVFANRVVACSPAARAEGVQRGQRRREAQGRCPTLVIAERDESREARAFESVVRAVETFTPRLELARPGQCAFATRGPSRYFGGDVTLAAQVHERVDEVVTASRWPGAIGIGVADGPFAAALAARMMSITIVPPDTSAAFLRPLPITALERSELTDVLVRLGLHTLGDFAALAAADVVARFGREGQGAHRLAAGLDERPPDESEPPPDLVVQIELDPPAERVDTAAFVAKSLADELFEMLSARGLSCSRVAITAETEHGESIERLWRHEGTLTPGSVTDRVRWQLDGWLNGPAAHRPSSGITLLRITPDEVGPALGRQLGFWGGETAADERAARALARVQGLLDSDAVCVPEWRGGRGPAEQLALVPVATVDLIDRSMARREWVTAPWPGRVPPPAPAIVYRQSVPAEVVDETGAPVEVSGRALVSAPPARASIAKGRWAEVVAWAGPWPVDERWWDPPAHRRRARFQLVLVENPSQRVGERCDETAELCEVAHLFSVECGRWWVEATYD